jgi:hypothetical protein
MTSYPANFIPIEDAFEEAVAKLAPGVRTVATDEALSSVDEDEADRIYQSIDEAERRVEKLFRDALADGVLVAWVNPGGQMEILSDREAWRPEALGIPGFEPSTHKLTNPGPNDDREVFIERKVLKGWLDGFGAAPRRGGGSPPEAIEPLPAPSTVHVSRTRGQHDGPHVETALAMKGARRNPRRKAPERERVKKAIIEDVEQGRDPTAYAVSAASADYKTSDETFILARNELEDSGELAAARERHRVGASKDE